MNTSTDREQLKGWLELIVLSILRHEPTCGYRIRKIAIQKSDHQFAPAFGRLYPLLAEMEQAGFLKCRKEPGGTRGQKNYALTARGEDRLSALEESWNQFSHAMNRITAR